MRSFPPVFRSGQAVQGEEGQQHEQRNGGVQQGVGSQDVLGLGLPHGVAKPGPFL